MDPVTIAALAALVPRLIAIYDGLKKQKKDSAEIERLLRNEAQAILEDSLKPVPGDSLLVQIPAAWDALPEFFAANPDIKARYDLYKKEHGNV